MKNIKLLSEQDVELINENFGLQLQYDNAEHYRAAMVIWTFWRQDQKAYEDDQDNEQK